MPEISADYLAKFLKEITSPEAVRSSFYIEKWNNGWAVCQRFPLDDTRQDEFICGAEMSATGLMEILKSFALAGLEVTIRPFAVNKSW